MSQLTSVIISYFMYIHVAGFVLCINVVVILFVGMSLKSSILWFFVCLFENMIGTDYNNSYSLYKNYSELIVF